MCAILGCAAQVFCSLLSYVGLLLLLVHIRCLLLVGFRYGLCVLSILRICGELKIAMRTNNSIQNILMNNKQLTNNTDKYTHSGVYKLSCRDCNKAYVGQTGRIF